jgi:hypothetical protein
MASRIDIVKVFYGTLSLMNAEKAGFYLAQDFQLLGFAPVPMDRTTWIAFLSALKKAVPDLKIRLTDVQESGDRVRFTQTGLGSHINALDLTSVGLPPVPAARSLITFPHSDWEMIVTGGLITQAELIRSPSQEIGLTDFLSAFSVTRAPAA